MTHIPQDDDPLLAALRSGLAASGASPVDAEQLLSGARGGARRIRRRRRVASVVAGLIVVVAVPLSAVQGGMLGQRSPAPAALEPDPRPTPAHPSGGAPTTTSGGTIVTGAPSGVPVRLPRTADGNVMVADAAVLGPADLPDAHVALVRDDGDAVDVPTTVESVCPDQPQVEAAGGRVLEYSGGEGANAWTLTTVVRVMAGTKAETQMDWLRQPFGTCAGGVRLKRVPVSGLTGDGVLGYQIKALPDRPDAVLVVGAVRQGRVLVGIRLVMPASAAPDSPTEEAAALLQAQGLLLTGAKRLLDSGLVDGAGNDATLV